MSTTAFYVAPVGHVSLFSVAVNEIMVMAIKLNERIVLYRSQGGGLCAIRHAFGERNGKRTTGISEEPGYARYGSCWLLISGIMLV